MEINHKTVERLQGIFDESWARVKSGHDPLDLGPDEGLTNLFPGDSSREELIWTYYMNNHDVIIVTRDDLVESFSDMVNFGNSLSNSVCILNPSEEHEFLLVPNSLAEKCLALGVLA